MHTFSSFSTATKYDPTSPAYWIKPSGEMVKPSPRHIGAILEDPKEFGETEESIKEIYDRHNEPLSATAEGHAREELMVKILKKGFLRIREVKRNWTVQVAQTDPQTKDNIWAWAKMVLRKDPKQIYADVNILQLKGNKKQRMTLGEISPFGAVLENKNEVKNE